MTAPRLRILAVDLAERPYRLRIPFRFGVTTVTHGRQALARVRIATDEGLEQEGFAAEALAAKWFDKDLGLTDAQNHHQLRRSLEIAREAYLAAPARTAFGHFAAHHPEQMQACRAIDLNGLVAGYGPALLDRAVLDALCRAEGSSFYAAMQANRAGIEAGALTPDLAGFDMAAMLAGSRPAASIHARHTVGLLDPITRADQTERVGDGLPETLEEVVAAYGQRYFKLKVGGDRTDDLDRLLRIASVLDRIEPRYAATLDGNEQYPDAEGITALWRDIAAEPRLDRLRQSILYVEQPIRRDRALAEPVSALAAHLPVIIDESDDDLDAFLHARALGYTGISSKTCKGFYRSILNLARCRVLEREGVAAFLSAEDLTTQAGISVQQDLALVNLLGLTHVERNGHHFVDGFAGQPGSDAHAALAAHPDLYHEDHDRVRLRITEGRLAIGSLACVGFGSGLVPRFEEAEPMPAAVWP